MVMNRQMVGRKSGSGRVPLLLLFNIFPPSFSITAVFRSKKKQHSVSLKVNAYQIYYSSIACQRSWEKMDTFAKFHSCAFLVC